MDEFDKQYVDQKLDFVAQKAANGSVKNKPAFTIEAIKHNYVAAPAVDVMREQAICEHKKEEAKTATKALAAEQKKAEEELEAKKWVEAKKRFDCLDEEEKEKTVGKFERALPGFLRGQTACLPEGGGYESSAVQANFKCYLKAELLPKSLS